MEKKEQKKKRKLMHLGDSTSRIFIFCILGHTSPFLLPVYITDIKVTLVKNLLNSCCIVQSSSTEKLL